MTDLVIFDIDGTLISFQDEEVACFNDTVLKVLGVSDFNRDWGSYKHVTFSGFVSEIMENHSGTTPSAEEMVKFENEFLKHYEPVIKSGDAADREIKGANEMLIRLRQIEDIHIAIATGNWLSVAKLKLTGARIKYDDIAMSTSNDALSREDIMKIAEKKAMVDNEGNAFNRVTYIGDAEWDAKASQNLNYDFIGITTKISESDFQKFRPKAIFTDYSDIEAFLDVLTKPGTQ